MCRVKRPINGKRTFFQPCREVRSMRMKIGDFAAFCDLSIRALRLYDHIGLLKPAVTDADTGYRYYEPEQMQTLNAIAGYKKLGFSLQEIRALLSPELDSAALIRMLRAKQKENEKKAVICRYNNENIQKILDAYDADETRESEQDAALRLSRIACLENDKLENLFSQILWL
jgi:DNA-binding transcriptional MerR regulator